MPITKQPGQKGNLRIRCGAADVLRAAVPTLLPCAAAWLRGHVWQLVQASTHAASRLTELRLALLAAFAASR